MKTRPNAFSTDPQGLPQAQPSQTLELVPGARINLRIAPVQKRIGDATVRMLAYNGSIPGPTLRVQQGSEVLVDVVNKGDLEATVHWHGLRLDNRSDGTTETQVPIPIGGRFTYRLSFPDPGVYWYHPHIREDYGQEMGLYGNIVVVPAEPDYWPPVDRELTLTLDDVLIEEGQVAAFSRVEPDHTAMGRFGNVLLVNGEPALSLTARRGEVVRLYLTNTANTRVFRVALPGARMKLIGGDSGHLEREQLVDSVMLAPSERAVVDVLFSSSGSLVLEHRTPTRTYRLAAITVSDEPSHAALEAEFERLRTGPDLVNAREQMDAWLARSPDKTLALVAEMDLGTPELPPGGAVEYFCPMHADVVSAEPGRCPLCKMKLLAREASSAAASNDAGLHGSHEHPTGEHAPAGDGIEWEDDMVEVNRRTNPANTRWKLIDRATGTEGRAIDWRFRVGERVKIRLVNEMESDHPMHHPFHIHGAGRFLVLARDGVAETNLVWKDTVLVPTGQTVDLLLDVTHPGRWMAHCHIAEHHESGMMLTFDVDP
jgi:FtsP/CotA-like multicopper oxidase with cupredoxin domain